MNFPWRRQANVMPEEAGPEAGPEARTVVGTGVYGVCVCGHAHEGLSCSQCDLIAQSKPTNKAACKGFVQRGPAQGFIILSKEQLLQAAGLTEGEFLIEGIRWNRNETVKIAVQSMDIPMAGGEIISTNPVHTEKEVRDAAVGLQLLDTEIARLQNARGI